MNYKVTIGLEVHVQLKTKSKMFCPCSAEYFGSAPNTHVCPVCLGLPGALPVPNEEAIRKTVTFGLALNSEIQLKSKFDRKNYFYPDLPKGYQISQFDIPFAKGGYVELETEGRIKKVRLNRAHLEEDTGKLSHSYQITGESEKYSIIDFNRCGVPLLEIVTEPDLDTPLEARLYAEKLHQIARYLKVADTEMEKAGMRFDANISLRPEGQEELGTKVEIKNINSFRFLENALKYEVKRQTNLLGEGKEIVQETRGYSEANDETISQRGKEEAHDYRYFPDPDIPDIILNEQFKVKSQVSLVELPNSKADRFVTEYSLSKKDAQLLTISKEVADWYEEAVKVYVGTIGVNTQEAGKRVTNWLLNDIFAYLNSNNFKFEDIKILPAQLIELVSLVDSGKINSSTAKSVLNEMLVSGNSPEEIVKEKGLEQISDSSAIEGYVIDVISQNEKAASEFRAGKENVLGFLVGQVMAKASGKANPLQVKEILIEKLNG